MGSTTGLMALVTLHRVVLSYSLHPLALRTMQKQTRVSRLERLVEVPETKHSRFVTDWFFSIPTGPAGRRFTQPWNVSRCLSKDYENKITNLRGPLITP